MTKIAEALRIAAREAAADGMPYSEVIRVVRSAWADELIHQSNDSVSEAARFSHIHRNTLHRMRKEGSNVD